MNNEKDSEALQVSGAFMRHLILALAAVISGCTVNGYAKYYTPAPGPEAALTDPMFLRPSIPPKVYAHSPDLQADRKYLEEDGYVLVGTSSFYGPANRSTKKQAIQQGKNVGASIIMIQSSY